LQSRGKLGSGFRPGFLHTEEASVVVVVIVVVVVVVVDVVVVDVVVVLVVEVGVKLHSSM